MENPLNDDLAGAPRLPDVARGYRRVLELVARGAPLPSTLEALALAVEATIGLPVSVMLRDDTRLRLRTGPSLLSDRQAELRSVPISSGEWACAAAARTGERVMTDRCWSTPVVATDGAVVGTVDAWCDLATDPSNAAPPSGDVSWFLAMAADLAGIAIERQSLVHQLHDRSFTDPLTGLPNRPMLTTVLDSWLNRGTPGVAVLAVDLDRFKLVNDSLGREAGDQVLSTVARRLEACVRPDDMVARFSGDEFGVVLTNVRVPGDAARLAERVRDRVREPMLAGGREVVVSPSIGIALASDGTTGDRLVGKALAAMHRSKERGSESFVVFSEDLAESARRRLDLEYDLLRGIEAGQFHLLYQPIVGLQSNRLVGVEALIRWQHPERGLISPIDFIPLAEETGAIVPIGRWVLREGCRQAAEWSRLPGGETVKVSVNISPRQFHQPGFVADVAAALTDTGVDPDRMILEITEGVVMADIDSVIETLAALKTLGVRLAVDDFGAGYSSLSYLKRFPLDTLKIDRSFVSAVDVGPADLAIVEAVVVLAERLGLRVVAEGVETIEQSDQLQSLGCRLGQGFLFSRPVPAAEIEARLTGRPTPRVAVA